MKQLIFLLLNFLFTEATCQINVHFFVKDTANRGVSNASVRVLDVHNREIASGITDAAGKIALLVKKSSNNRVEVTHVKYIAFKRIILNDIPVQEEIIILRENITVLKAVMVTGKKPVLVMEPDKYVLNINGQTTFGNTVTDILKKAPGIHINANEITLEGKPVTVQVNGKTLTLSGKELLHFLSASAALNINQIELITTVPSSMDAGYSGGIINLKIRKLKTPGFNGNLSLEIGHRAKSPNENFSTGLYFKKGKISVASTLSLFNDEQNSIAKTQRYFLQNPHLTTIEELSNTVFKQRAFSQLTAFDLQFTRKTIIGLQVSSNFNTSNYNTLNTATISSNQVDSIYTSAFITGQKSNNNAVNINLRSKLDSSGSEISIDMEYNFINSKSIGDQNYKYRLVSGSEYKDPYYVNQATKNKASVYGIKVDYKKKLKAVVIETGVKLTNVQTKYQLNESRQISGAGSSMIADSFDYVEKIIAGYINCNGKINEIAYNGGLRAELTDFMGKSFIVNQQFNGVYFNLFPTFSLSKQVNKKNSITISFRRSISRPRFRQLNPFRYYTSPFYYFAGNPDLKAYYPNSVRLGYNYNNKILGSVSWGFAKNKITEINDVVPNSNITQSVKANNGKYNTIYAGITYYDNFTKWWYSNSTISAGYNSAQFIINNEPVKFYNTSFSFYSTQQFSFDQYWKAELYTYISSATYYDANYTKPFWYLDISISKQFKKANTELAFSVKDIFYTNITRSAANYGNVYASLQNKWDSRQFLLTCSRTFGNMDLKPGRRRSNTATSEEQRRLN